ncbi:MAG: aminotransferase class V-fold PLP-dependent enzyme [Clostridia bacterium]|nr:aminotransferase class V-fold PLP-dependent enzyme [Clostridia bacterium]
MIYLDNAASGGKKPPEVIFSVQNALKNYSSNPGRSGHNGSINTALMVYNARKTIVDFFGADNEQNVVFTLNCTHALNYVIKGVLQENDHIVISSLEHNAVMRPVTKLQNIKNISYDMASVSEDDDITVENFKKLINKNTKMVVCTHASNVTGKILPIEKIGKLCKEKGVLFAVDAAQSAGVIPINMQKMNIDFLCLAPHKSLLAPMGVGVLISRSKLNNTVLEGGTGTESLNFEQPLEMPEMLESGTINVPAIAGVTAGIEVLKKQGINNIYKKELGLIKYLYEQLNRLENVILYTKEPKFYDSVPLISFNIKDYNSFEVAEFLNKNNIAVRAGLHCAPTAHKTIGTLNVGTIRVSVGYFNNYYEINYLINVLKKYKKLKNCIDTIQ